MLVVVMIETPTAMFTVIRAVLLKPLAYRDPDRLVHVSGSATSTRFAEMRTAARSYTELGAFAVGLENMAFSGGADPEPCYPRSQEPASAPLSRRRQSSCALFAAYRANRARWSTGIQGRACAAFSSRMKPSLSPHCREVFTNGSDTSSNLPSNA
jgi:hypothetical protein